MNALLPASRNGEYEPVAFDMDAAPAPTSGIAMLPVLLAVCAAGIAVAGIAGWMLDLNILHNTFGGAHGIRFSTAVIQLLVAAAIIFGASPQRKTFVMVYLSFLAFMPLVLIEAAYAFSGGSAGVLPFSSQDAITDPPSPVAALSLVCISITLLAEKWYRPLHSAFKAWPAVIALLLSLQAIIGEAWHIVPSFEANPFARMSPNAALANGLLAMAALAQSRSDSGTAPAFFNWRDKVVFLALFILPAFTFFWHTWTAHIVSGPAYHVPLLTIAFISSAILAYVFNTASMEANSALQTSERVLKSNTELFERIFANAPVGMAVVALDGKRLRVNKQHCINSGRPAEDIIGKPLSNDIHPDDLDRSRFSRLAQGLIEEFELDLRRIHPNGRSRWLHVHATLQRDIRGKPSHVVVLCHDIDERRQREEAHALIVGEMNHRIKNTLATIQGLVREISDRTRSPDELPDALQDRLMAISRAHDSLMQANWEGLTLELVFRNGFFSVFSDYRSRFDVQWVDVALGPQTSVLLSLVLHELMTNSIKYGAMSVPAGRLEITSSLTPEPDERILEIVWSEKGCHGITAPQHRGFGSFMLDRGIKLGLGGKSQIVYRPEGILYTLRIPMPATRKSS